MPPSIAKPSSKRAALRCVRPSRMLALISRRPLVLRRRTRIAAWGPAFLLMIAAAGACAAALPSVASINLCADQLVLTVAAPEQVLTVSWLSADPEESLLAAQAARYPLNYGSAEELLRFNPDVVIAGAYTNAFTRALLARLGYRVIELEPEESVADIARNLRLVAAAIGRDERGERARRRPSCARAADCRRAARTLAGDRHRETGRLHGRRALARGRAHEARGRAERRGRARARPLGQPVDGDAARAAGPSSSC